MVLGGGLLGAVAMGQGGRGVGSLLEKHTCIGSFGGRIS